MFRGIYACVPTAEPELDFNPPPVTNLGRLEKVFTDFHSKNPRVYQMFCERAQLLIDAGFKRYSADGIMHTIRFDHDIAVRSTSVDADGQPLKINNNTVRFFAEKWTAEHPSHPEFFQSRKQHEA